MNAIFSKFNKAKTQGFARTLEVQFNQFVPPWVLRYSKGDIYDLDIERLPWGSKIQIRMIVSLRSALRKQLIPKKGIVCASSPGTRYQSRRRPMTLAMRFMTQLSQASYSLACGRATPKLFSLKLPMSLTFQHIKRGFTVHSCMLMLAGVVFTKS